MSFDLSSTDLIWLVTSVLGLIVLGSIVLTFGRKLPRHGDWLVGLGLAALFGAISVVWSQHWDAGLKPQGWWVGWIWPRSEASSITVGTYRDTLGVVLAAWVVVAAALLGGHRYLVSREKRPRAHLCGDPDLDRGHCPGLHLADGLAVVHRYRLDRRRGIPRGGFSMEPGSRSGTGRAVCP